MKICHKSAHIRGICMILVSNPTFLHPRSSLRTLMRASEHPRCSNRQWFQKLWAEIKTISTVMSQVFHINHIISHRAFLFLSISLGFRLSLSTWFYSYCKNPRWLPQLWVYKYKSITVISQVFHINHLGHPHYK